MIQSALINLLKTNITTQVYASVAPPKAIYPCITVDLEGSFRERHWEGGNTVTGLIDTDFELTCWGSNLNSVYDLGKSVVNLLENFSGPALGGDSPQTVYNIAGTEIVNESSDFDSRTLNHAYSIFISITHR